MIMFNMEYIAANVGAEIDSNGGDVFKNDSVVAAALTGHDGLYAKLSAVAVPIKSSTTAINAYVRKASEPNAKRVTCEVIEEAGVSYAKLPADAVAGEEYCVRYMYHGLGTKLEVSSQFIPKTLYAILTQNLYVGDDTNPEAGTTAGQVVIKIPRFQLSGSMELSMTASGTSDSSLEGSALASNASGCDGAGIYAEIIQVLNDARWYDGVKGLVIEDSYVTFESGEAISLTPVVYAWKESGTPTQVSNTIIAAAESDLADAEKSSLVFTSSDTTNLPVDASTGKIDIASAVAGDYTVTVTAMKAGAAIAGLDASMTIHVNA